MFQGFPYRNVERGVIWHGNGFKCLHGLLIRQDKWVQSDPYMIVPVDHCISGSIIWPSSPTFFEIVKLARILVIFRNTEDSARCIPRGRNMSSSWGVFWKGSEDLFLPGQTRRPNPKTNLFGSICWLLPKNLVGSNLVGSGYTFSSRDMALSQKKWVRFLRWPVGWKPYYTFAITFESFGMK